MPGKPTPTARSRASRKPATAGGRFAHQPAAQRKPRTWMDAEHAFKRRDWDPTLLAQVQGICMGYPGVVEAEQFGGPWWKVGKKPFCLYAAESQKRPDGGYRGVDGVCFKVTPMDQSQLLRDPRFARPHYIGQHGWTTLNFEGPVDWDEVEELVDIAYRGVAGKRLLAQLDGGARPL